MYENEGISGLFIMKTNDTVESALLTISISFPFLPRVAIMVSQIMQVLRVNKHSQLSRPKKKKKKGPYHMGFDF